MTDTLTPTTKGYKKAAKAAVATDKGKLPLYDNPVADYCAEYLSGYSKRPTVTGLLGQWTDIEAPTKAPADLKQGDMANDLYVGFVESGACGVAHSGNGYVCTIAKGHIGPHIAQWSNGMLCCDPWPAAPAPKPTYPYYCKDCGTMHEAKSKWTKAPFKQYDWCVRVTAKIGGKNGAYVGQLFRVTECYTDIDGKWKVKGDFWRTQASEKAHAQGITVHADTLMKWDHSKSIEWHLHQHKLATVKAKAEAGSKPFMDHIDKVLKEEYLPSIKAAINAEVYGFKSLFPPTTEPKLSAHLEQWRKVCQHIADEKFGSGNKAAVVKVEQSYSKDVVTFSIVNPVTNYIMWQRTVTGQIIHGCTGMAYIANVLGY